MWIFQFKSRRALKHALSMIAKAIPRLSLITIFQIDMLYLILSALLTIGIFWADALYGVPRAICVIYGAPLLILANSGWKNFVAPWAYGCCALTLTAFALALPASLHAIPVTNLAIGLTSISATAFLLSRSANLRATLATEGRRYQDVFNNIAIAIWEHDLRPMQDAVREMQAAGIIDIRSYLTENPAIVAETRGKIRIIDVNAAGLILMKVASKENFFNKLGDFLTDDDVSFANCMIAMFEGRPCFQEQCQLRTATGELIDIIVAFSLGNGEPLDRVAAFILDVTEQVRLSKLIAENRRNMARVEQVAALGQMSASIAHELEQPLTAIQTSLAAAMRWLRRDTSTMEDIGESLELVNSAARRARDVLHRIRGLVGKSETQPKPLPLDDFLLDASTFLHAEVVAHGARLIRILRSGCIVTADEILLQQVVTNLVRNALQAMSTTPQHRRNLTIETEAADGMATIRISDTGPGWTKNILDNAFQAFRSTKIGGMGLGLSICRTIVEAHKGHIRIANQVEGGALVEISLPMSAATPDNVRASSLL